MRRLFILCLVLLPVTGSAQWNVWMGGGGYQYKQLLPQNILAWENAFPVNAEGFNRVSKPGQQWSFSAGTQSDFGRWFSLRLGLQYTQRQVEYDADGTYWPVLVDTIPEPEQVVLSPKREFEISHLAMLFGFDWTLMKVKRFRAGIAVDVLLGKPLGIQQRFTNAEENNAIIADHYPSEVARENRNWAPISTRRYFMYGGSIGPYVAVNITDKLRLRLDGLIAMQTTASLDPLDRPFNGNSMGARARLSYTMPQWVKQQREKRAAEVEAEE